MADNDNFKDQLAKIKSAYDITEVVQQENIELHSSGPGKWKGLCPFHTEKTPSFTVNENFQNYRCFGCGAHGDIFTFIENIRGCEFMDAVKYLASMKNIKIEFSGYEKSNKPKVDIKGLYNLMQDSYNFYRAEYNKLPEEHPAKQEVIKRGLDVNNPVFCYAPERYGALLTYLSNKGYSKELMVQSELIHEKNGRYFDFFHARLMITLSDYSGRPVSYSARKLFEKDNMAKYVNGKQSPVFQKKATLFNLDKAKKSIREKKTAIVCEGPFDVLALQASGIENAVASCGTAFTEEQLRSIEQIVDVDGKLIFSFDGDSAGVSAAIKTFNHFPIVHGNSNVVLFPNGMDPCDYLIKYGSDKMGLVFKRQQPIIDFVLMALGRQLQIGDMQSKFKFAKLTMSKYVPVVTETVLRDYMIRRISVMAGIPVDELRPMLGKPMKRIQRFDHKEDGTQENNESEIPVKNKSDASYVAAFALLLHRPELLFKKMLTFKIPNKYRPFIRELQEQCRKYYAQGKTVRIIAEEFSMSNFVKKLQDKKIGVDYTNDTEISKQFTHLLEIATQKHKEEIKVAKNLSISQALSQAKTHDEIIKLLQLATQDNKKEDD